MASNSNAGKSVTDGSVDLFRRLLDSAGEVSFDARKDVDFDAPVPADKFGMTPEWSPLYGTPIWESMTHEQRVDVSKHEFANVMGLAIWLEMTLQIILLRTHYGKDAGQPDFQFALNECADESLHSLMFARAAEKLIGKVYTPPRWVVEFGRLFRMIGTEEFAYGIILAGEELLDVMQRDFMRSENVQPLVRQTSYIHVVEESRHMAFARAELKESLLGASRLRRNVSGVLIAGGTHVIARALVNPRVYKDCGLDWKTVHAQIDASEHHRMMFRRGAAPLVEFLHSEGLLNRVARWGYRKSNLL